jgi:hypothetical protein
MYEVVDTHNGNDVVSEHETWRKAFNATRRLEPELKGKEWRYLVRKNATG